MREQVELVQIIASRKAGTKEVSAWQFLTDSKLRPLMIETYKELYREEPLVSAVHTESQVRTLAKRPDLNTFTDQTFWISIPLMSIWTLRPHREPGNISRRF